MTGQYNYKVDIWSLGCVMIELATAAEPWAEKQFDSSLQAMFYIATHPNEIPAIPNTLSESAVDFIKKCFIRQVDLRPSASELLNHPFILEEYETELKSADKIQDENTKTTPNQPSSSLASTTENDLLEIQAELQELSVGNPTYVQ